MQSPFFGFRFGISCNIPARQAGEARWHEPDITDVFRYVGEPVVRTVPPDPIGGRFGIITKALLALAKGLLGPLAVLDVGGRPSLCEKAPR